MAVELTGTTARSLICVLCSAVYTMSVLLIIAIAYATRTWQRLSLFSSIPLILFLLSWPIFPESPRWLLARKHYTELEVHVRRVGRINGQKLPPNLDADLPLILRQIDNRIVAEKTSFFDCFCTPNLRKKTLFLILLTVANHGMFVGLNLFLPAFGKEPHLNALLANIIELPPCLFSRYICDKLGRRLSFFGPMLLYSVLCLVTACVSSSWQEGPTILGLVLAAKFCITFTYLVGDLFEEVQHSFETVNTNMPLTHHFCKEKNVFFNI